MTLLTPVATAPIQAPDASETGSKGGERQAFPASKADKPAIGAGGAVHARGAGGASSQESF